MFTRRSFLKSASLAGAALVTSVAYKRQTSQTPQPLQLGFSLWAGYMPFQVAESKGFFQANGLNAQTTWFPLLSDQIAAFNSGKVDVVGLTLSDFLTGVSNGVKAKAILAIDTSLGADAIVVAPSINSLQEFAGKTASVEIGTVSHMLFLQALKQAGLQEQEVMVTNQAADAAIAAFMAGRNQIAVAYEPFVSQAVTKGKGKVLFSSRDIPGLITDLLLVRQEVLEQRPNDIQKLADVWYQTLDYRQANLSEALAIKAKRAGTSVEEYQQLLEGLKWHTASESLAVLQPGNDPQSVINAGKVVSDFLTTQKIITAQPPAMTELLDDRFLQTYLATA